MDVGILFDILVLCLVGGLVYWIALQLPLPEPFKKIAVVVVLVILLIVLLNMLFGSGISFHAGRFIR